MVFSSGDINQTMTIIIRYMDPGGQNTVRLPATIQISKIPIQTSFVWWLPIVSIKYRWLYQFCYAKIFSTNQDGNLIPLDDPGRVRSQIASVVCQIQWFDFDCNLVVTRKVIFKILWTDPPLCLKPLYSTLVCTSRYVYSAYKYMYMIWCRSV